MGNLKVVVADGGGWWWWSEAVMRGKMEGGVQARLVGARDHHSASRVNYRRLLGELHSVLS